MNLIDKKATLRDLPKAILVMLAMLCFSIEILAYPYAMACTGVVLLAFAALLEVLYPSKHRKGTLFADD